MVVGMVAGMVMGIWTLFYWVHKTIAYSDSQPKIRLI